MFNENEMAALQRTCAYLDKDRALHGGSWRVDPGKLAAALDKAGVCGFDQSPREVYVRVTVELATTQRPAEALAWAGEHSVFDMLDLGASVSRATIYDENGEIVGEAL